VESLLGGDKGVFTGCAEKTGGCKEHEEGELVGGGDEICGGVDGGVEGDTLVGTKLIC
jgi:hypothetical protein